MRKIIWSLAAVFSLALVCALPTDYARAACEALPNDKGLASLSVTIDEAGEYSVWLRILAPTADHNSVILQIDDQCPAIISSAQISTAFQWRNSEANSAEKPVRVALEAGKHTLKIAGRQTNVGVDKILLLRDANCVPTDMGENCLSEETTPITEPAAPAAPNATQQADTTNWFVLGACLVIIVAVLCVIIWKYRMFMAKASQHVEQAGLITEDGIAHMPLRHKIIYFLRHHKIFVAICCCIVVLASIVGVVAAATRFWLEAESATLYGGAKIVDNTDASGDKYVAFEQNPPGNSVPQSALQQTGGNTTVATSNNTNNQNGGGTQPPPSNNNGNTPSGECPAYPAFPDDSCTGWQHTGVTLKTCVEEDGNEGDGHLEKANVTYDGCDFTNGAVVHGENVIIKRSRIQGVVNSHWSTDYDFQNLQLIDVEIITATPSQIAAKTMIDEEGGSATNGANMSCLRCRIHYVPTGISLGNGTTIQDSYVSDVTWSPGAHQAAIGAGGDSGHNSKIIHNRLECNRWNTNAPGFQHGCSSALSLYDEPTLNNVLVEKNLFDTTGGFCAYGGGPQGTNIRFLNNQFGKKYNATCGMYGSITAFHSGNSGNVWSGNIWQDGSGVVNPSE